MMLDDIRMRFPTLGFAVYAYEPFGVVTVEVHDGTGQVFTFTGLTEAEALSKAFPPEPKPEPAAPVVGYKDLADAAHKQALAAAEAAAEAARTGPPKSVFD